jgi:hypothetical protein
MEEVSSGLQLYSTIKNSFFLIILCCCCLSLSYCYIYALGKNYTLSTNAKTTFKHFSNNAPTNQDCSVNAPEPDCFYVNEYVDNKNNEYKIPYPIIDPKKPPNIGSNKTYFEEKNPRNYIQSFVHPAKGVLILVCIVIILLIIASINLYFIRTNKGYGAVMGGIEATNDIYSMFKSKK